jgi:hypothetical protein
MALLLHVGSCDKNAIRRIEGPQSMLRIERLFSYGVVFSLSGRIETGDVAELQRLLSLEPAGQNIALDLQDVTLVERDAVEFLARWESAGIELENCPAYVREWIAARKTARASPC